MSRRLLTSGEVAMLLEVSPMTVRRLADRGELSSIRLTSRSPRRFRPVDVLRFVEAAVQGEDAA